MYFIRVGMQYYIYIPSLSVSAVNFIHNVCLCLKNSNFEARVAIKIMKIEELSKIVIVLSIS